MNEIQLIQRAFTKAEAREAAQFALIADDLSKYMNEPCEWQINDDVPCFLPPSTDLDPFLEMFSFDDDVEFIQ